MASFLILGGAAAPPYQLRKGRTAARPQFSSLCLPLTRTFCLTGLQQNPPFKFDAICETAEEARFIYFVLPVVFSGHNLEINHETPVNGP
jgi:hypothetical protein